MGADPSQMIETFSPPVVKRRRRRRKHDQGRLKRHLTLRRVQRMILFVVLGSGVVAASVAMALNMAIEQQTQTAPVP